MGDPTATFALALDDQTSGPAAEAANALGDLKEKIDKDVKAIGALKRALRNLKGGTAIASSAIQSMKDRISAQKAEVAAAQLEYIKLGGAIDGVKDKMESMPVPETTKELRTLSGSLEEVGSELSNSEGAIANLGGSLSRLGGLLANPIALIGLIVTALGTLATASFAAASSLVAYSFAQSEASRADRLRLDSLAAVSIGHGRMATTGRDMQNAISDVAGLTGTGRAELERYARQLERTGLSGQALTDALELRALDELGPNAAKQILGLERQTNRLRAGLSRIFSGLRIDTFLGAINQITQMFSQTTESGKALKAIVEALFQPLFDDSGRLGVVLRSVFEGMIIGALGLTIAFLRVRNALRGVFGDDEFLSNAELIKLATFAGTLAVSMLAGAFIVLAGVVVLAAVAFGLLMASLLLIPALIVGVAFVLHAAITGFVNFVRNTDWSALGLSIVNGIIGGLRRGAGLLGNALRNLATNARSAFTNALGIESPSTVFAAYGLNIAEGVSTGIDSGGGEVDSAVSGLVDVPVGGSAISGSGGGTTISIGDININAGETSDPRELVEAFVDQLSSALEGVSIEMGAT